MSSSLNKIHVNNSTNISLNDRFTLIQTLSSSEPNVLRSTDTAVKGSAKNTQLIRQLEKRRKIMAALKIKKRSLRRNLQQRVGNNTKMMHDFINTKSVGRLRRSNSLAAIATLNADKIQKPIQRRNSVSIADRLGYRRGGGGSLTNRRGGPGLRRPLNRNNFNNLRRSNSKQNLNVKPRNRTRSNGNSNVSAKNGAQNRSRSRSRSRSNIRNRSVSRTNNNTVNNRSRSRSRSNIRTRSNSVNSRLGANRTNAPAAIRERRGRTVKGRVFRRSVQNTGASNNNNVQARRGRSRTRSVPRGQIQRQRSRSRSRPNNGGRNNNTRGQRRGGVRRGTSSRGRGNARGRSSDQPPKSKEELDKELEQYMENTKDQEMQDLLNGS